MSFQTQFAASIYAARYEHPDDGSWAGTSERVIGNVMGALPQTDEVKAATNRLDDLMLPRRFIPGGRYLAASGRDLHQVNNCILLRCPDSREGWADTGWQAEMALMTGAGIGVWYGDVRGSGSSISRTGGTASGPVPKMEQINDTGRHVLQGGNRRSAIWAGLPWSHPDIFKFIVVKDWPEEVRRLKAEAWERGEDFPAKMDRTNISVTLDDAFFAAYGNPRDPRHEHARLVYTEALAHMLRHGEPGFSIDTGDKADEVLRNACTEITSADDSDVCNLGSLVLSRFDDVDEFERAARDAALFLTAGSVYSDVPYEKVAQVRDKNRRLGLGLIGVHEFLLKRGLKYGTDDALEALEPYMEAYSRTLEFSHAWQDELGLSHSAGATAIAPNGTIGIIAESTPSADPMFSAAEIRTVINASPDGDRPESHVVVDPVAKRLVEQDGIDPTLIEDAYMLSHDPERRIRQQAFLQDYTDHAISSTINLPAAITDVDRVEDFGSTLMKYLPRLRGMTCYPDGAISGQPRQTTDLAWALEREGQIIETVEDSCIGGVCGI